MLGTSVGMLYSSPGTIWSYAGEKRDIVPLVALRSLGWRPSAVSALFVLLSSFAVAVMWGHSSSLLWIPNRLWPGNLLLLFLDMCHRIKVWRSIKIAAVARAMFSGFREYSRRMSREVLVKVPPVTLLWRFSSISHLLLTSLQL
ncbi:hypothetical protein R1sor_002123 [Riccia sorocarpa]|uniref:Uncharacterized protein n=1 Tax=Riccia sorocarpa TaxID=122646 RepID=A0ABD3H233_9MARC